jgi:hypothetical protein
MFKGLSEPGHQQQQQELQSPLALSLTHDMSSLQHQLHQLQASCTLFEQQQQAANASTTAVSSSLRRLEQRMQQLEQQGQRHLGSSRAADSASAERLHMLEQQVAWLADSAAENQVSIWCDCSHVVQHSAVAAAMHEAALGGSASRTTMVGVPC